MRNPPLVIGVFRERAAGTRPTMTDSNPNPDQEHFGEASLGEAQSENPPSDPEMIRGDDEEEGTGGTETYRGDQDAEPTAAPEQAEEDRDQAEG